MKGGEKDGRPHRRAAREPGQGLTAAAISGVVRALGNRPSFSPYITWSPKLSYTVLARRYRSKTFDDVIGQEPIAKTLRNAIDADRTAHAYLFCGTRGVGKTSMARIFARELNSSSDLQESEAIGEAVLRGDDLDVIEIDGASNRGSKKREILLQQQDWLQHEVPIVFTLLMKCTCLPRLLSTLYSKRWKSRLPM